MLVTLMTCLELQNLITDFKFSSYNRIEVKLRTNWTRSGKFLIKKFIIQEISGRPNDE